MNFYDNLSRYGDQVALIEEHGREITYDALARLAEQISTVLISRRLAFHLCQNSMASIVGYIGMLQKRVVPVLINEALDRELLADLVETYRPSYLYVPRDQNAVFTGYEIVFSLGPYILLQSMDVADYTMHDDLALLLTTSGSTGSPKLVRQSYRNIDSNAASIVEYLELDVSSRVITTLPMYYTFGLSVLQSHLLAGGSIVLTDRTLMDPVFWDLMKTRRVTTLSGVPYIYEMMKKLRFQNMQLPDLKVLTQAGGRLEPDLVHEFAVICAEKGMQFIVMYGAAEATARMSYLPSLYTEAKADSIGIAIPNGKFRLIDEGGRDILTSGEIGELVYEGDNVTMGYAENRFELVKGDSNQGVLRTGDLAKRDEENFYYIVGRKKRFLKIFGNRVNLTEIESVLRKGGFECACAGQDDQLRIYLTDASQCNAAKMYVSEKTGIHPTAFHMIYIQQIPRNAAGKILYAKLK